MNQNDPKTGFLPQTNKVCSKCSGTGLSRCFCGGTGKIVCPICCGRKMIILFSYLHVAPGSVSLPCSRCDNGYLLCAEHSDWNKVTCLNCSGKGFMLRGLFERIFTAFWHRR